MVPSTHTVRVNGLSNVGTLEFQFRLKTVSDTGYNPSLRVTGYKDNRLSGTPGVNMVDMIHVEGGEENPLLVELGRLAPGTIVMVKTLHDAGERINMDLIRDGRLQKRFTNMPVYKTGDDADDHGIADGALMGIVAVAITASFVVVLRRD